MIPAAAGGGPGGPPACQFCHIPLQIIPDPTQSDAERRGATRNDTHQRAPLRGPHPAIRPSRPTLSSLYRPHTSNRHKDVANAAQTPLKRRSNAPQRAPRSDGETPRKNAPKRRQYGPITATNGTAGCTGMLPIHIGCQSGASSCPKGEFLQRKSRCGGGDALFCVWVTIWGWMLLPKG